MRVGTRVIIEDLEAFRERNKFLDQTYLDEEGIVVETWENDKVFVSFDPSGESLVLVPVDQLVEV